jgi:hypothetical protein
MTRTLGTTRYAPAPTRERHVQHVGVVVPDLAGIPHPTSSRCLCYGHGHDPDLWFDDTIAGERRERAKAICVRCPLRQPCLDYARAARQHTVLWGVWGGIYFGDRGETDR